MAHTRRTIPEAVSREVLEHVGEFMDEQTTAFEPIGTIERLLNQAKVLL